MKLHHLHHHSDRGSVLVVTMSILAVAALVIASYLLLVQNETSSIARSQNWNATVPVAEAGIEEGMAMVNLGAPDIISSPWAWTNAVTTSGWSSFVSGVSTLTRTNLSGGSYYTVTLDITGGTNLPPVITSIGFVPLNSVSWIFSRGAGPFVAAAGVTFGTSTTTYMARKIQVRTVLDPLFSDAIVTKATFNMNGNNTTVDSFDSSNPLYSTAGQYNVAQREAGGDVGTDAAVVGDISIGNGNIYGTVSTGPGSTNSTLQVGSQGAVGDANWNATHSGVESNYWSGDFNVTIPDVSAPPTGTTTLPAATNGVVTLNGGTYTISPNDPNINIPLNVTAPTVLWVQGSFTPAGVTINNNGTNTSGKLTLYIGTAGGSGDSMSLGGNQTLNQPGYAVNFQVYGLPSLTSISMHGNAGFVGTIYAPEADATFGGGGNNTSDTAGAIIVNSLTMSGHWNFHYDESLRVNGPTRGWIPQKWNELKYP